MSAVDALPAAGEYSARTVPPLLVRRLHDRAILPVRQTPLSAGLDLPACLDEPVTLQPGDIRRVPCGVALAIAPGYEGQVRPRSGLSSRHGVTLVNAPGTIDADYRGELQIPLINLGREPFTIEHGMRIAQLVIAPVALAEVAEVEALPDPDESQGRSRGEGGFGSTGLH